MLPSTLSFFGGSEIYNEKEFDALALVVQNPQKKFLTFVNEQKYLSKLNENAAMVITKRELKESVPLACGVIVSETPALTFFRLHNFLGHDADYARPAYKTVIGQNCNIGRLASIAEENVTIGNNVVIEDFATVYPNTVIGDNVVVRSGARIGGQGFEYKRCPDNTILTVNHYGGVVIGHDADIHCNTCIDRAVYPWDDTVIGEYTIIDNLVHVGHAVKIGARCLVVCGSCFGGRTETGDDCWFGIATVIKNAITIGNEASVTMGSVLANNIKDGEEVSGFYAVRHEDFLMSQYQLRKLGRTK